MSPRTWVILFLTCLVLSACAEGTPTAGEAREFASACDKANDGKRIAVVGYLRFPESYSGDLSMVLRLYSDDGFGGTPIGVETHIGTGANQVEAVPDQYSDRDLKVHLAGGKTAVFGTRVRVSGKVYFPLVDQDFNCGLQNPLVEAAD